MSPIKKFLNILLLVIIFFITSPSLFAATPGTLKWKLKIDCCISSPAIGSDGTIYVGSLDHYLYAIYPNGSLKWKFKTGSYIKSPPVIGSDGTVYVGSVDDYLYAIKMDGSLKWKYKIYPLYSSAIAQDGTIYSAGNYLYAINSDGTLKWKVYLGSHIESSPAIGEDGTIYVGSEEGYLFALTPNGDLKWKYKTESWIHTSPVISIEGIIYIGSDDQYLYAIYSKSHGLADSPWPMFLRDTAHSGSFKGATYFDPDDDQYLDEDRINIWGWGLFNLKPYDHFPNDPAASRDTDEDGMPDEWNEGATEDQINASDLVLDSDDDNDGISDEDEISKGYDPKLVDTDEDGYPDNLDDVLNLTDSGSTLKFYRYVRNRAKVHLSGDELWKLGGTEKEAPIGLKFELAEGDAEGLTISESGIIEWNPSDSGTYTQSVLISSYVGKLTLDKAIKIEVQDPQIGFETGDDMSSATEIDFGKAVYGQIGSSDDKDYYTFEVGEEDSGIYRLELYPDGSGSSSTLVEVRDKDGNLYGKGKVDGDGELLLDMGLPVGQYSILIQVSGYSDTYNYGFSI